MYSKHHIIFFMSSYSEYNFTNGGKAFEITLVIRFPYSKKGKKLWRNMFLEIVLSFCLPLSL